MTTTLLTDLEKDDLSIVPEFQPEDWPDISLAYTFYYTSWYCRPMKLRLNNEIIGIGNILFMHDTAWLSQIIIRPAFRNQGWGRFITQGLLGLCKDKVRSISLLATPLGYPVYEKSGFKTQGIYYFYQGQALGVKGLPSSCRAYTPLNHCDVLEMDKEVSGEIRARLIQDHLRNARITIHGSKLLAYYLPSLGEGLIVSVDPQAGLAFMYDHLRTKEKIVVPVENEIANEFLLQQGYKQYRQAHRMVLGQPLKYKPEHIFCRIGGNLG